VARKTKQEKLQIVHSEAMSEFDSVQSAIRDERKQCLQDRRFYSIAGAQWEGPLGEQFENKPKFEVNKIHLSVIRIINEYRNNRISVNFVSKDGLEGDSLADVCDGLYRADEEDSGAEEAYDNAFEEACAGGFGAWRLRTEYEDDEDPDDERQRIKIEPIFDADSSVFFDLQAKRQDKADAKRCWILTSMTPDAYEAEYDESPASWPKSIHQHEFDWLTPDVVYVAEYFVMEETRETIHVWELLDGTEKRLTDAQLEDQFEELEATGAKEVRTKKVRKKRVHKYIMSGGGVLEDCGIIAGSCIPVIPVYGKRWFVDNVERCMGHVRLSKDAQRLKNMQLSKLGEISALSATEKPILTPEQIAGHQVMWSEDNIKNYPYLLINPMTDKDGNEMPAAALGYTRPPTIPPAMAALLQITEQDMQDLLGNQQQGEKIEGNISTETAMIGQNRLDMQTFIYMSNLAKAMRRCGEVWLSMAKDVLVEEGRMMKSLGSQGEMERIELLRPTVKEDGSIEHENDLARAKMDVVVEVGPSSSTKRQSTVRSLTKMASITDDPETKQVLGAMAMMNMEGEGISDVRAYFRKKLLRMGVVDPTEQEAKEMSEEQANAKPSANDEYLKAAAEKELAEASEKQANVVLKQAQTDKTRAEAMETVIDTDIKEGDQAMKVIESFGPRITPPDVTGSEVQE
tara:strand:- start:2048 stop:4102 length:2055 start_codon:yes stop_codon:yes gene_type:complete